MARYVMRQREPLRSASEAGGSLTWFCYHLQRPWWALEWERLCLWAQEVALGTWEALTEDPVPGQSMVCPPFMQSVSMLPEIQCTASKVSVAATMHN